MKQKDAQHSGISCFVMSSRVPGMTFLEEKEVMPNIAQENILSKNVRFGRTALGFTIKHCFYDLTLSLFLVERFFL